MELSELKSIIDQALPLGENVGTYAVFACVDREVANAYVDRIAEVYGMEAVSMDSVAEAVSDSSGGCLLDGGDRLYVVRDDAQFASDDKAWGTLSSMGSGFLIMVYSLPFRKTSFATSMGRGYVEFGKIAHRVLVEQLAEWELGEAFPKDRAEALVNLCEDDYGRLRSEADKVRRFAAETGVTLERSFDALLRDGQLGVGRMNDRYHFANSFVMGSPDTFRASYGVDALELISLLYAQCRAMYLVLCNNGNPNVCKATGMSYAQVNAYRYKKHTISLGGLLSTMKVLQEAERGIKTGSMPKESAIKYVMSKAFPHALAGRR